MRKAQPAKKANKRLPEFLRPVEMEAMLAAASSERDRLIVLCGLGAGLRVSEICRLRIEDVDLEEGTVLVHLGKGRKDRYVAIPSWLAKAFRAWFGERRMGWIFPSPVNEGRPLGTRAVQLMVGRLREASSVARRCSPHTLRHSYATALLRSGADITEVQRLLGHSSPNVTARYLHCDPSRLQGVVAKLKIEGAK